MRQKYPSDPNGPHLRIYWRIVDSPAWQVLSYSQRALYIACRRKLNSHNNGNLAFTLSGLAEAGFDASSSTLASGLRALRAVGLIAVTREGGKVSRGQAIPTLYRFTDQAVHEWTKLGIPMHKATDEWRRFRNVETAADAIEELKDAAASVAMSFRLRKNQADQREKFPIR